jgi:hypothetical protein
VISRSATFTLLTEGQAETKSRTAEPRGENMENQGLPFGLSGFTLGFSIGRARALLYGDRLRVISLSRFLSPEFG